MKGEFLYPVFTGALTAAMVCFFTILPRLGLRAEVLLSGEAPPGEVRGAAPEPVPPEAALTIPPAPAIGEAAGAHQVLSPGLSGKADPILAAYGDDAARERVIALFGEIVRSPELAEIIVGSAVEFDISPSLALALCWEESQFKPRAVNRKNRNQSVDRGLFQLNSLSFPKLTEEDFFNPRLNAYYGMAHLRWCLDAGGSELAGLAMYNAGANRVRAGGTPMKTLHYVSKILALKEKIDELFILREQTWQLQAQAEAPVQEIAAVERKPRLVMLLPVRGMR